MQRIKFAVVGLLGVGAGFFLHLFVDKRQEEHPEKAASLAVPAVDAVEVRGSTDSMPLIPDRIDGGDFFENNADTELSPFGQLRESNPVLYWKIEGEHRFLLEKKLFEAAALSDPAYAASLLSGIEDEAKEREFAKILIDVWRNIDPIAAYNWYCSVSAGFPEADSIVFKENIFSSLSRMEPAYAWGLLDQIDDPEYKEVLLMDLASGWTAKNPEESFNWLESMARDPDVPPSMLKLCYGIAMNTYVEMNPEGASLVVARLLPGELQSQLTATVAQKLAEKDMDHAIDWILQLESSDARASGFLAVISNYAEGNPGMVLDSVLANPDLSTRGIEVLSEAFSVVCANNPELAAGRLEEVPGEARAEVVQSMMASWIQNNEAEAIEWLNSQEPGPSLDAGAGVVAERYFEDQPTYALAWACVVSDGEKRAGLLNTLVESANMNSLKQIYLAMQQAPLDYEEQSALLEKIDNRLRDEYTILVMP